MKKSLLIGFVTAIAAVAGVVISILAFLKRGEKQNISDDLDYEGEEFLEEDFEDMDLLNMDLEESLPENQGENESEEENFEK